jgi:hypothetical protein
LKYKVAKVIPTEVIDNIPIVKIVKRVIIK